MVRIGELCDSESGAKSSTGVVQQPFQLPAETFIFPSPRKTRKNSSVVLEGFHSFLSLTLHSVYMRKNLLSAGLMGRNGTRTASGELLKVAERTAEDGGNPEKQQAELIYSERSDNL